MNRIFCFLSLILIIASCQEKPSHSREDKNKQEKKGEASAGARDQEAGKAALPDSYNISGLDEFVYEKDQDENDFEIVNVPSFYPIGWSENGQLFAYRVVGRFSAYEPTDEIIIRNIIFDEDDATITLRSDADPDGYLPDSEKVNEFLHSYRILPGFSYKKGSTYLDPRNNLTYTFSAVADQACYDMESWDDGNIEISAKVNAENTKVKKINTVPFKGLMLYNLYVHGVFESPTDNRVAVMVVTEEHGFEGEHDINFELYGCRLNLDDFQ